MSDNPVIRLATEEGTSYSFIPVCMHNYILVVTILRTYITHHPDVPYILQFIRELADYEHELDKVEATHESLLATLSFPGSTPKRGSTYTALVIPPATAETPNPVPVGMARYFYNYSTWRSAPGLYLEDLYVQPSQRGKGYGIALFRFLAREVRNVGGKRLEWSVLKWNEPSIRFYKALGAQEMVDWAKMMLDGEALEKLAV